MALLIKAMFWLFLIAPPALARRVNLESQPGGQLATHSSSSPTSDMLPKSGDLELLQADIDDSSSDEYADLPKRRYSKQTLMNHAPKEPMIDQTDLPKRRYSKLAMMSKNVDQATDEGWLNGFYSKDLPKRRYSKHAMMNLDIDEEEPGYGWLGGVWGTSKRAKEWLQKKMQSREAKKAADKLAEEEARLDRLYSRDLPKRRYSKGTMMAHESEALPAKKVKESFAHLSTAPMLSLYAVMLGVSAAAGAR